jgi:sec-independent protein translocase protein TatA
MLTSVAIMGLSMQELLVILLIVVVLFGATKLPQIGRGLGEAIRNFKQGVKGDESPEHLPEGRGGKEEG